MTTDFPVHPHVNFSGPNADSYRLLVEGIKDYAIYLLDPQGRIASWNTGAQRLKGHTADEVLGCPFAMMFSREDQAAGTPQLVLDSALDWGKYEEEGVRLRKDGTTFWAIYTVTPQLIIAAQSVNAFLLAGESLAEEVIAELLRNSLLGGVEVERGDDDRVQG